MSSTIGSPLGSGGVDTDLASGSATSGHGCWWSSEWGILSCIGWYDAGDVVVSVKSVKPEPCCDLASLPPLTPRLEVGIDAFLNNKPLKDAFLGAAFIWGTLGFVFEPLAVLWRIRCFVLKALPTLRGSIISFTLGCGFEEVFACFGDDSAENKEVGDAGGDPALSVCWCVSIQAPLEGHLQYIPLRWMDVVAYLHRQMKFSRLFEGDYPPNPTAFFICILAALWVAFQNTHIVTNYNSGALLRRYCDCCFGLRKYRSHERRFAVRVFSRLAIDIRGNDRPQRCETTDRLWSHLSFSLGRLRIRRHGF